MTSWILLLKKTNAIASAQLSKGLRDSAATITKLLETNNNLCTECWWLRTHWNLHWCWNRVPSIRIITIRHATSLHTYTCPGARALSFSSRSDSCFPHTTLIYIQPPFALIRISACFQSHSTALSLLVVRRFLPCPYTFLRVLWHFGQHLTAGCCTAHTVSQCA